MPLFHPLYLPFQKRGVSVFVKAGGQGNRGEGVEIAVVGRASQIKAGSVVAAGANIEKEEA